jgi:WD40 repeat protein
MGTIDDRAPGGQEPGPAEPSTAEQLAALRREIANEASAQLGSTDDIGSTSEPRGVIAARARRRFAAGAMVGHHEIIRLIGEGGMGEVYLARDTRLGRRVALKFLLKVDAARVARFAVEAQATAQLAHENIVALHDVAEHEGVPYMVLEHVQGKPLSVWLKDRIEATGKRAGLPPSRAAELMIPVVRALVCAHDAGIVHRDLKPENIMLADSGAVKVLDFGIAKLLRDVETDEVGLGPAQPAKIARTLPGAMMGTLAYMSPEQWGEGTIDARTDIWAVGILLFEMVVGEHPLAPISMKTLASVAMPGQPMPSVRERLPAIGKLGAIIDRCLIKDKASRLGSARELLGELEVVARPGVSGAASEALDEGNPYAGLSAFQERDAGRFFGRERAVAQVVARLAEQPLLALVGSSGAGKSSLVRAGVIPALKRGGDAWEAFVLRPGPHPLAALAELLLQVSWQQTTPNTDRDTESIPPLGDRDALVERLRREPGLLGVQMRARARRRMERILLFVDQLEELVTLTAEDERAAFLACLIGAADDASSPLRILVSVRQDFLDRIAGTQAELADLLSRGTVLVGPMGPSELRDALIKPVERLGYHFESAALVTEMLDALAGTAGALPLLQFTAARLWDARDQERQLLTEARYRAFGGVSGALASHADSVLAGLSNAERRWTRLLLLRLITPERTRAIVTRSDLADLAGATSAELERVLGRLIDARLVMVEGAGRDESTVELVHESLITTWPALVRWLEEEQGDAQFRARLRSAAKEWEASGGVEGLLWRGEAAEEATRWQKHHGEAAEAGLGAREIRYLAAVVKLDARERLRRRRLVAVVIACLSAVVVVVSGLAFRASRAATRAEEQSVRAEEQSARADAEKIAAQRSAARARNAGRMGAASGRQGDPTTMLALLREIEPGPLPQRWDELARTAKYAGVAQVVLSHGASVSSAVFSPDGRQIVSASRDKVVRIWNAEGTGPPLALFGHEDVVNFAAFSPDGRRIVSASEDRTVRIWNVDGTGQPLVLRGHDLGIRFAAFSPDGRRVVSASEDRTLRLWNADGTGQSLVLRGHEGVVFSAAFSLDGRLIASASEDKTVRVWNADGTGQPLVLRGHNGVVSTATFSPDGRRIVSASYDSTLRAWNADGTGQPLILPGHEDAVNSAAFSRDGRRIVSASSDKTVRVWNADGSGQSLVLHGDDSMNWAAFSPDGRRVVSASHDKTVRVWSVDETGQPLVLRGHDDVVYRAAWSTDGLRLVSSSADKTVRVWNADGTDRPFVLRGHDDVVEAAVFSPDGRRIASASADRTLRVWNADGTGQPLVLRGHDDRIYGVSWSPNGQRLVSASRDRTVRVWNADGTGRPLVLRGHDDRVYWAAWSADGELIVSASADRSVRVWSADGTGHALVLRGHEEGVSGAAFSPDGRYLVSASFDKTVRVWNADGTGQPVILRGHDQWASVRADKPWSPDGSRIVSTSADGTVRIWNSNGTGEPIVLHPSSNAVFSASWSPDGKRIVAAVGKTLVVWSDLEPLRDAEDPKLWSATTYCMPLDVRRRLLDFSEEQSQSDLDRCLRHVLDAHSSPTAH